MSDYQYGDYDKYEGEEEREITPFGRVASIVAKTAAALIAVFVIGTLVFRMSFGAYYPRAMKSLYETQALALYRQSVGGEPEVLTQKIRVPYEDASNGYFMADNLIVVPEAGNLQCSIRLNKRVYRLMAEAYGWEEIPKAGAEIFTFVLYDNHGQAYPAGHVQMETKLYYVYYKLVFDGVDLSEATQWCRVNIHIDGVTDTEQEPAAAIAVYENNDTYSFFEPY
ncbi:MAG: hypothetical protein WDA00_00805 [Eubacteriales bacterium]